MIRSCKLTVFSLFQKLFTSLLLYLCSGLKPLLRHMSIRCILELVWPWSPLKAFLKRSPCSSISALKHESKQLVSPVRNTDPRWPATKILHFVKTLITCCWPLGFKSQQNKENKLTIFTLLKVNTYIYGVVKLYSALHPHVYPWEQLSITWENGCSQRIKASSHFTSINNEYIKWHSSFENERLLNAN